MHTKGFILSNFEFALSKYTYQNALVFPSSTALSMGSKEKMPFGSSLASIITVAIPYWYTTVSPKLKSQNNNEVVKLLSNSYFKLRKSL